MARAEASVVINRSVKDVADYLDDPANAPEWMGNMLENEKTSEGPTQVGTTGRGVASFLGRRLEWNSQVTEFEPYSRIKRKVTTGPLVFELTELYEPLEAGTRLTLIMEGEPKGFFRLADALVVRLMQRDLDSGRGPREGHPGGRRLANKSKSVGQPLTDCLRQLGLGPLARGDEGGPGIESWQ